jgi:hypothetical protein
MFADLHRNMLARRQEKMAGAWIGDDKFGDDNGLTGARRMNDTGFVMRFKDGYGLLIRTLIVGI